MTKPFLALTLALLALPVAALADPNDSAAAPSPLTPAQRQAISSQIQAARQKEMQMHQQLRSQILDTLTPDHRTAVANAIGAMVISASPDPAATAKQIDALLSPAEQQKIVSAHNAFVSQSQALMKQVHDQIAQGRPNSQWHGSETPHAMPAMPGANDAGTVVLMVLAHHGPMMGMMGVMPRRGDWPMGPGGNQPPGGPPPGGPPPDGPPPAP
jgi:hypothetical protein